MPKPESDFDELDDEVTESSQPRHALRANRRERMARIHREGEEARRQQTPAAFVTVICPQCGNATKGEKKNPPRLPEQCATCHDRNMVQQVDAVETEMPSGSVQRGMTMLQQNLSKVQGEQRKMSAELTALRGDIADMRRALQQFIGAGPAKARKARG